MTTNDIPRLGAIVLDCPDPVALAGFYAQLLEWPVASEPDDDWVTLDAPGGGVAVAFQRAEGFRAPTWPAPDVQQQFHLDLTVDDMDAAHERAVAVGAQLLDDQSSSFRVYADPVGHPFCLCAA